jgi:DNA-binding response OmpR family regulator
MPRAPATIVVLEENAAAQELMDQALRASGDRILISNTPKEVLLLSRRVRIDLVVGDAGLLDKSDPAVVEDLRSMTRILYTNIASNPALALEKGCRVLRTPFSLEEFREAVAAALGEP